MVHLSFKVLLHYLVKYDCSVATTGPVEFSYTTQRGGEPLCSSYNSNLLKIASSLPFIFL